MYHPTTRVLTVLELLQSHWQMSGPKLAERLEVDIRSVRRYITMLQELGIPIEAERGRYGTYRLRPGYKLPPLMFTEDEALAMTLGLLAARRLGLAVAAPAIEGALAKVDRVLPATLRERVQAVQEMLILDIVSPDTYVSSPGGSMLLTFSTAAQQERQVWMRYRSGNAEETERAIDPYGLGYLARTIATMPGTWSVEVLLETTLEEAKRGVPATVATLEEVPYGVVLRCYSQSLDWMAHFLVGLRCPLIVRDPPELRDALRLVAAEIAHLAERTEGV